MVAEPLEVHHQRTVRRGGRSGDQDGFEVVAVLRSAWASHSGWVRLTVTFTPFESLAARVGLPAKDAVTVCGPAASVEVVSVATNWRRLTGVGLDGRPPSIVNTTWPDSTGVLPLVSTRFCGSHDRLEGHRLADRPACLAARSASSRWACLASLLGSVDRARRRWSEKPRESPLKIARGRLIPGRERRGGERRELLAVRRTRERRWSMSRRRS